MSEIEKKSRIGKKKRRKVILAIVLSSTFILLIGIGILGYSYLNKRISILEVTNIQLENEPIVGTEVNISISARYPTFVADSDIKVYMFSNRCKKTIHIWVYGCKTILDTETYTNQTTQYSFPKAGTWFLIAGDYKTEITVS